MASLIVCPGCGKRPAEEFYRVIVKREEWGYDLDAEWRGDAPDSATITDEYAVHRGCGAVTRTPEIIDLVRHHYPDTLEPASPWYEVPR